MTTREEGPAPDAIIIGAPKAGTSALHAALARHPQVHASAVKEPKYYMCTDAPPPAYRGPGDAHSQREWVWRRQDYQALFAGAPTGTVRLESTPFYLYLRSARQRIAEELPAARFVVVVRDPIDRAYSNWMHLWVDGLESEPDFVTAWRQEDRRIAAGWAPFWHYRRMGAYGEQLADLFDRVPRERVLVLRYRQLVDSPAATLDRVAAFLGIEQGQVGVVPPDNSRGYVEPGLRTSLLGPAVRLGAAAGAYAPPQLWRRASRPLVAALQHGGPAQRPRLSEEQRSALLDDCVADIALLEDVLGESFADWRSPAGRGSFTDRSGAQR